MPEYYASAGMPDDLDEFTRSYLETAEWCGLYDACECGSCGCEEEGEGHLMSDRDAFDEADAPKWSEDAIRQAREDCAAFQETHAEAIGDEQGQAGHDFWLTRNGHGAGFWDGDWPKPAADQMTEDSHAYGGVDVSFDAETETLHLG